MLERKRQILVLELMSKVEAARVAQEQVQAAMQHAHRALERAARAAGVERLTRESHAIPTDHRLGIRTRSVMGVEVPEVSFSQPEHALLFGLTGGASGADDVLKAFRDALAPIIRLAEVENAVMRLAREVRRTQRRVHALENRFIPDYDETLDFIADSLAEREREDIVIMKKVKRRRELARLVPCRPAHPEEFNG